MAHIFFNEYRQSENWFHTQLIVVHAYTYDHDFQSTHIISIVPEMSIVENNFVKRFSLTGDRLVIFHRREPLCCIATSKCKLSTLGIYVTVTLGDYMKNETKQQGSLSLKQISQTSI